MAFNPNYMQDYSRNNFFSQSIGPGMPMNGSFNYQPSLLGQQQNNNFRSLQQSHQYLPPLVLPPGGGGMHNNFFTPMNMSSKKHQIEFNEREEQLFDILNKYNHNLLIKPQLNLEREYALKAAAARQEYSNDWFNFTQQEAIPGNKRNGLIDAYRNQQSKSVGQPNNGTYGFQGLVQPGESPEMQELRMKMRYTEKYKQMRDQVNQQDGEAILDQNQHNNGGQYALVVRGNTQGSTVNFTSADYLERQMGKDPAEAFANRAIDAHFEDMKVNQPFSSTPMSRKQGQQSFAQDQPRTKAPDFNFKPSKPPKYQQKKNPEKKYTDGYAFENIPEQPSYQADAPHFAPSHSAMHSRGRNPALELKDQFNYSQATAKDLGLPDLQQDAVLRTSTEQHPRQRKAPFDREQVLNIMENMDDETLYKAVNQIAPLMLPPIRGAMNPSSKRQTENVFAQSMKYKSPFQGSNKQKDGFVNRLFKSNKKIASAQNLPQKLYLEQFQESLKQISRMVPGGSIFMRKMANDPLLQQSAKYAQQSSDAEQMFLDLQDRLIRFEEKKITTMRGSDEDESPPPEDGGDYLGLRENDDPTSTKVRKLKQKAVDLHKNMFQVDPRVREENIRRKKMKQLLKELRKPAYRNNQVKLHPSLRPQSTDDENIQILEALLKADEQGFKHPELVVLAPQMIEEVPKDKGNFPLQNYLQNKKIKDISSTGGPGGTPYADGNGINNQSLQDSSLSPVPNAQSNLYQEDLKQKLKTTKEELNEVLKQMDAKDTPQAKSRQRKSGVDDQNDEDLSPETRKLMDKVMNNPRKSKKQSPKKSQIIDNFQNASEPPSQSNPEASKQLKKMLTLSKQAKENKKQQAVEKIDDKNILRKGTQAIRSRFMNSEQIEEEGVEGIEEADEEEDDDEDNQAKESEDSAGFEESKSDVKDLSSKNASQGRPSVTSFKQEKRQSIVEQFVLKQPPAGLMRKGTGVLNMKMGSGGLKAKAQSPQAPAIKKVEPPPPPPPPKPVSQSQAQKDANMMRKGTQQIRQRFMNADQIEEEQIEGIEEEDEDSNDMQDLADLEEDLSMFDPENSQARKSRKSRASAIKRPSEIVNYNPPNVTQFHLQQPPAGGLQRKGTGRVDFGIRVKGSPQKPPPEPPKPKVEEQKAPQPKQNAQQQQASMLRKGTQQIRQRFMNSDQIEEGVEGIEEADEDEDEEEQQEDQEEAKEEEEESDDMRDMAEMEEDLSMYDQDNGARKSRKSRISAKRISKLTDYVPPSVEQFKLQQPPAGGLQRKGTGRVDFGIRAPGKAPPPKPTPPPQNQTPAPQQQAPKHDPPPSQNSAKMLRKGTQQIRQRFMNADQIEEEQIEGIIEEESDVSEAERLEEEEEDDDVQDLEVAQQAYTVPTKVDNQTTAQPKRQSIVEQFTLKQPPGGGLQRKGTGVLNMNMSSKLGSKGKAPQPPPQPKPLPAAVVNNPQRAAPVNFMQDNRELSDESEDIDDEESPISPLNGKGEKQNEFEIKPQNIPTPPPPIIAASAPAFGRQQTKVHVKGEGMQNIGSFARQQTNMAALMAPTNHTADSATQPKMVRKPTAAGAMGIQPKSFGSKLGSAPQPPLASAPTMGPSAQSFTNSHIVPEQPQPKMVRKPTAVGGFGVKPRAFGAGKASPSPSPAKSNLSTIVAEKPSPAAKKVAPPNQGAKPMGGKGQSQKNEEIDEANTDEYGDEQDEE